MNWGYNTKQRGAAPDDIADVLAWLARNTREVKDLADPALSRQLLAAATSRLDGTRAAATSVRRNRAVLLNALDYAVELKLLDSNPIKNLKWRAPKVAREVDRRVVVNPAQARALLEAVRAQQPSGPRLVAFFGVLYYSGLRPEEAVGLRRQDVQLPDLVGTRLPSSGANRAISGANFISGRPGPTSAGSGPTTDQAATAAASSTAPRARAGGFHAHRPSPSCSASTSPTFDGEPSRPAVPGCPGPPTGHHHLPPRLGPGTQDRTDGRGVPLPAGSPALRPSPRMPVHLAQRRSSRHPGRRVGRP